jgi:hypothetical protein
VGVVTITTYTVAIPGRVSTVNKLRTVHFHERALHDATWRTSACWEAVQAQVPKLDKVKITACPWLKGRRSQDVAACLPSVKAAIDGLVDAGVLPDDTPNHVLSLEFLPPALGAEVDELVLTLEEVR